MIRRPLWLAPLALAGCFAAASPNQRVTDAARELNQSSQFGQMGIAVSHVAPALRSDFLARRASWGRELKIVDLELSGLSFPDPDHALVTVDVSWSSVSDSLLRATRIGQQWDNLPEGWLMTRERRISGDHGLFGEVLDQRVTAHPDVHRPSRTIK